MDGNTESIERTNRGWPCAYGARGDFAGYVAWYFTNGEENHAPSAPARTIPRMRQDAMCATSHALLAGGNEATWERLIVALDGWVTPTWANLDDALASTKAVAAAIADCDRDLAALTGTDADIARDIFACVCATGTTILRHGSAASEAG